MIKFIKNIFKQVGQKSDPETIATAVYTHANSDGKIASVHVATFLVNVDDRFIEYESTNMDHADVHFSLLIDKINWHVHGILPQYALRVEKKSVVSLQLVK